MTVHQIVIAGTCLLMAIMILANIAPTGQNAESGSRYANPDIPLHYCGSDTTYCIADEFSECVMINGLAYCLSRSTSQPMNTYDQEK